MTTGRPRKPNALHVLEGTHRQDRHGPKHDPLAGGELTKPAWLSTTAGELWDRIIARYPAGTLSDLDTPALTMLCHSFDRWKEYASSDAGDEYKRATMAAMYAKQFIGLD